MSRGGGRIESSWTEPGDEFIYYNILASNPTNKPVPFSFTDTLGSPILEDANNYWVSCIRFVLDGSSIPIFFFKDNTYWVSLTHGPTKISKPVVYNPSYNATIYAQQTVYSYQAFMEMINDAYIECFNALVTAYPLETITAASNPGPNAYFTVSTSPTAYFVGQKIQVTGCNPAIYDGIYTITGIFTSMFRIQTDLDSSSFPAYVNGGTLSAYFQTVANGRGAPIMVFNQATGTCPIMVPQEYADYDSIFVWMNTTLYNFFNNFWVNFNGDDNADHLDYNIVVRNEVGTNTHAQNLFVPVGYYLMNQESSALYRWYDITTITFVSPTLGTKQEYTPTANKSGDNITTSSSAGSGPNSTPMITDFQPFYQSGDNDGPRGYFYFSPTSMWRFINMINNRVNQISLTVQLRDRVGNDYQYYIPPNQSAQIKIAFTKRNTFGGMK